MNLNTQVSKGNFIAIFGAVLVATLLLLAPMVSQAHEDEEEVVTTSTKAKVGAGKTLDYMCMGEAVEEREDALMDAWGEMSSSTMSALEKRKTALHTAWEKPVAKDRALAVAKAWKEWKASKKSFQTEFRKDRKAAWDAFKKTAKESCKMTVPKDEALEKTTSDSIAI